MHTATLLTRANDTAASLTQELAQAREDNRRLRAEYETIYSLEAIEEYARDALGMTGRSAGQIIYIR